MKAPRYPNENRNEITQIKQWKSQWKRQGILMKIAMKSPWYTNENYNEIT